MDWRHNQWIGVIAAVAVVIGIVGVFVYLTGSSTTADFGGYAYRCESTQQTFSISDRQMEELDNLHTYGLPTQIANLKCKLCDKSDAARVYYCSTCKQWYAYTATQATAQEIRCPQGHEITF